jgi:hypothetical protein
MLHAARCIVQNDSECAQSRTKKGTEAGPTARHLHCSCGHSCCHRDYSSDCTARRTAWASTVRPSISPKRASPTQSPRLMSSQLRVAAAMNTCWRANISLPCGGGDDSCMDYVEERAFRPGTGDWGEWASGSAPVSHAHVPSMARVRSGGRACVRNECVGSVGEYPRAQRPDVLS